MRFLKTFWFTLSIALFSAHSSYASSPCYFLSVPCDANPTQATVSGGAYPSFADMFNLNPASIPTISTPVGIESIASSAGNAKGKADFNVALIKGFERIGSAVSSNSDNTFYTYNLLQAARGTSFGSTITQKVAENTVMPTINIGSAYALVAETAKKYIIPSLGLNARYNQVTRAWDLGYGLSINSKHFSFGLSAIGTRGSRSIGYPDTTTSTFSLGMKYQYFNFEYTALYYRTSDPTLKTNPAFSHPMQIFTASGQLGKLFPTLAYREATNINGEATKLLLLSLQYQFSEHLVAALLHNYLPGSSSLGMQVFF